MKKIFRLALVFAFAGAALMYTGCTKDYSEEINNLDQKVNAQDKKLTDAIEEARSLAALAATKADLQNYAKLSDLNSAIEALEGNYDGTLEDLADDIANLKKAVEALQSEEGLTGKVNSALKSIAELEALYDQIQSIVLVPTDIEADAAIVFDPYDFGREFGRGPELYAAKVLYQVFPAEFAAEVGTKYTPEALVVPVRKGVDVDFTLETNFIKADPTTGFVEVSYVIIPDHESLFHQPNLDKGYAVSLKLTDEASHTEIASEYYVVEHEHSDVIDLIETAVIAKDGKVLHPHSNTFRTIQLLYDNLEAEEEFFEGGEIAFEDYYGNLYTKAEVEAMFGGRYKVVDETDIYLWGYIFDEEDEEYYWVPLLEDEVFAINGEPAVMTPYGEDDWDGLYLFDADPVTVGIACKTAEEAAKWIESEAIAYKYIGFADAAATDTAWFSYEEDGETYWDFAYNYAEIVPSYAEAITYSDPIDIYWNWQNWNYESDTPSGYELAYDSSLPANVAPFTNKEGDDFCDIRQFCGFLSEADFNYLLEKGNGDISAFIGPDGTPNHRFDEETRHYDMAMAFASKSTIAASVFGKHDGYWPKEDQTFYAVWAFLPENDTYLLVVPVNVYTKPAKFDRTIEIEDEIEFGDHTYTIENLVDSIWTKEFEDALVRGVRPVNSPDTYPFASQRDCAKYCFFEEQRTNFNFFKCTLNGKPIVPPFYGGDWINPFNDESGFEEAGLPTDFGIAWDAEVVYEDVLKFDIHFDVYNTTFKVHLTLNVEEDPGYALSFIPSDRVTISADKDTAYVYAPINKTTGIPEVVSLNQVVKLTSPASVSLFENPDVSNMHVCIWPDREGYDFDDDVLGLQNIMIYDYTGHYDYTAWTNNFQTSWTPSQDDTQAWIDDFDPSLNVVWPAQNEDEGYCTSLEAQYELFLNCYGNKVDSVVVVIYSDDPFDTEKGAVVEGHNFVYDASNVANQDITMGFDHVFDFLTVKSSFDGMNYLPERCNDFFPMGRKAHILAPWRVEELADDMVANDGWDFDDAVDFLNDNLGCLYFEDSEFGFPWDPYKAGYLFYGETRSLGVYVYFAPVKDWKDNYGKSIIDDLTNFDVDYENGQITLLQGNTLSNDITITIPFEVYHFYNYLSEEGIPGTVTVTFKK